MNKKIDLKNIIIICLSLIILVETIFGFAYIKSLSKDVESKNVFYDADTIEEIDELKKYGKPMIVVFGADYCPTCINYKPYVKEFAELFSDELIVKYVDTVEHESIRYEYNIELVPSTLFFDENGEPFNPTSDFDLPFNEEIIEERLYVSDHFDISDKSNDIFEFGVTKENELGYCKYVGLLDLIQLEEIALELMK